MSAVEEIGCCGVFYEGNRHPAICPNCLQPWGWRDKPVVHTHTHTEKHRLGYIAWCSCGVGSPPKFAKNAAELSLEKHIATGEFPS